MMDNRCGIFNQIPFGENNCNDNHTIVFTCHGTTRAGSRNYEDRSGGSTVSRIMSVENLVIKNFYL